MPYGPETPEHNGIRIHPKHAKIWRTVRSAIAHHVKKAKT
jgi:hypothetical protein